MTPDRFDVCVVGGGLIGLATARALTERMPGLSLLVVDKEDQFAKHQSSHNSGVIHSGLYYKPGSLKARLCVEGRRDLYAMCQSEGIAYRRTGKLVIATHPREVAALDELERRGVVNGLTGLRRLRADEIADHEPEAIGISALLVAEAGVVDFEGVARHQADRLRSHGATLATGQEVERIRHGVDRVEIETRDRLFRARALVNCAGLQADLVARMAGVETAVRIVPFRGEYYRLKDTSAHLVRNLIYPVPDPRYPFLGVHFTRRIDGTVEVGPNAVLAWGREHYRDAKPDWGEVRSILGHAGFRKLARRNWVAGASELVNSRSTRLYTRLAKRLIPALSHTDLMPGGSGVRAQAVDHAGNLVDDFVIERAGRTIHVLNAPSPGATASIAIGRHIAHEVSAVLHD